MDPIPKVGKLPEIRETLLKRRKEASALRAQRVSERQKNQVRDKEHKKTVFKRIESYIKQSRRQTNDLKRAKRVAKQRGDYLMSDEPRVAFVVRVRGINQVHPRVRKILQLLRLLHINSGVFVQLNEASLRLLRIVEPYVVWGYPNAKTVHDLVYKRGYGRVLKSRVPLNDNKVVETALGEHDVLCVDDIVHQIVTCGPKFREVSNFLWPFKLDTPSGGWRNKHAHFVEGGDFGCREEQINALLRKMI